MRSGPTRKKLALATAGTDDRPDTSRTPCGSFFAPVMRILGISGGVKIGNQDGAAALVVDGQLVAAAEEERFLGIKFANGLLPEQAIRYCLAEAGLTIADLDVAVFAGRTYQNFKSILTNFFEFAFGAAPPIELVDHHTAHAASAYWGSGWPECLAVTMDSSGDGISTTVSHARDGEIKRLATYARPNSLGFFYSAVTQFLGFRRDSEEYKVMGMAAYGRPTFDFSSILAITDEGYRFDSSILRGVKPDTPAPSKQERLFDRFPLPVSPRVPRAPITQTHYDIAASAQYQLEQAVCHLVQHHLQSAGVDRLVLAGGVALNCLMNQKLREHDRIEQLFVLPVCSDAGLALGAAYLHAADHGERIAPLEHAYWGPQSSEDNIRQVLRRAGARFQESSDPVAAAIQRLSANKIVGWFQGRMEYGPRALGNRSILGMPADAKMKDIINARVKFREEFRPLAPAVLHERGGDWFDGYIDSPFMTQTFTARPSAQDSAPATVHADGTSRLQSVHAATNPLFARLIHDLATVSGTPIVLNTSLNAYNDPIACEPHQALRTFYATGLDSLIMGPFVLDKDDA